MSVWDIVNSAKMQLDIPHQSEDLYLYKQALDAEKFMFSNLSLLHQVEFDIPVSKGVAEVPKHFYSLVGVRGFKDKSDRANERPRYPSYMSTSFYPCERDSINNAEDKDDFYYWHHWQFNVFGWDNSDRLPEYLDETFQIVENYIYFSDGCDFEVIDLAFKGLNLDEEGDLKIPETHERALEAYVCFRYTMKHHERFPMGITERYRREWGRAKRSTRGHEALGTKQSNELVGLLMNNYFPNFHLKK